jgi:hypothetical protein
VFPSAFRALGAGNDRIGLAVECPSCSRTSVNLVTHRHVDVPFYNDRKVDVVEHIFSGDRETTLQAFRLELDSGRFDARRPRPRRVTEALLQTLLQWEFSPGNPTEMR